MEKVFYVNYVSKKKDGDESDSWLCSRGTKYFATYEEAEDHAKRKASSDNDGDPWHIFGTVAVAVGTPPTNVEVTKL